MADSNTERVRLIATGQDSLPLSTWQRLHVSGGRVDRLTHYLFRYPAKFHPPVARALLERYTSEGDLLLDPFCGSGTLLVEASVLGRPSIGLDIDPVAVAVARVKVHRYEIGGLRRSAERIRRTLGRYRRPDREYQRRMFQDVTSRRYKDEIEPVRRWVPAIPNLFHWFRRYVIVDLARIRRAIDQAHVPDTHKAFFQVVFGSIIRNASNADPVPVSGLEVTSQMKRRDEEGRLVDPFNLFEKALSRAIDACEAFNEQTEPGVTAVVAQGDATRLDRYLRRQVDAVVTSPPYHGAVDYYRRHQLEMFWLGLTNSRQDRLKLLHGYIGRPAVPKRHPYVAASVLRTALVKEWEARMRAVSEERANAFRHYMVAMTKFFEGLARRVPPGAPAVLVVGHSDWNESEIPTTKLFAEISGGFFSLEEVVWYPVKNRYMSYSRHNNADIDTEYVLVLRRTTTEIVR